MSDQVKSRGDSFPSTHWSEIASLSAGETEQQRLILSDFLERYLAPMELFLKAQLRIRSPEDRRDILQGFVLDKLICNKILERAQQSRGRLRNFIKTCLRNYANSWFRANNRGVLPDAIRAEHLDHLPANDSEGGCTFEREWAHTIVADALRRQKEVYVAKGSTDTWDIFWEQVINPVLNGATPTSIAELAQRFDLTHKQVHNKIVNARRTFRSCLRARIGEYEPNEDMIEEEIRDLLSYFGNRDGGDISPD